MSDSKPDSVLIEAFEKLCAGEVAPWLEIYAAFPDDMRGEFPDVVRNVLGLPVTTPMATLVAPLFGEESDRELRRHLIARLASDPCEQSAQTLNDWRGLAPGREERAALRSALQILERRGVQCVPTSETRISAWMSSADGMGSYHVIIEIRMREIPIFLAFAVNVEAGLREAERFGAEASDSLARFGDESGLAAASVAPALAVREVRAAAQRCQAAGRDLPEGWNDTLPWLDKIPAVTEVSPEIESHSATAEPTRLTTRQLAARREYESWFLPPVAELRRSVGIYLASSAPLRTSEARDRRELLRIISEYVVRPRYRDRLISMLGHQVRLYRLRGDRAAERAAERSEREVARGQVERGFLRVFAERSLECLSEELLRAEPLPPDDRREAWREALRPTEERSTRRDVVRLDFAILFDHVLAAELDMVALAERPTEDQLVEVLVECVDLVVDRFEERGSTRRTSRKLLTRQDLRKLASGFTQLFHRKTSLQRRSATTLGRILAENAFAFANDVCGDYCVHACPARLDSPGDALFECEGHPARLDLVQVAAEDDPLRGSMPLEQLRRVVSICEQLGLEDPRLDDLAGEIARLSAVRPPLEDSDLRLHGLRTSSSATLRNVLRQALQRLPRLQASSDPETRSAWERFTNVYSALPVELVSRMIAQCRSPADVIAVLFSAADDPRDFNETTEVASATHSLWNATPRPELDGRTPNQVRTESR